MAWCQGAGCRGVRLVSRPRQHFHENLGKVTERHSLMGIQPSTTSKEPENCWKSLMHFGWRFHQPLGDKRMRCPENFSPRKINLWPVGNGKWLMFGAGAVPVASEKKCKATSKSLFSLETTWVGAFTQISAIKACRALKSFLRERTVDVQQLMAKVWGRGVLGGPRARWQMRISNQKRAGRIVFPLAQRFYPNSEGANRAIGTPALFFFNSMALIAPPGRLLPGHRS